MNLARSFIRVYRLPPKLTHGYCFQQGNPITFTNVDWFEAVIEEGTKPLEEFIKTKRYYNPNFSYLILADEPSLTFTIGKIGQ